jgi:trehalose synthase
LCDNTQVAFVSTVDIDPLPPERYASVLSPAKAEAFTAAVRTAHQQFEHRAIWNVNSTAVGGGVAEMLRSLLAYARGAGVDTRWAVIRGNRDFFEITKRIHNHLHNFAGDGGPLGETERAKYEAALQPNAAELEGMVGARDVVILHDPQTAGLVPGLKRLGVPVIWRCHVGIDTPDDLARRAWQFLIPYVKQADAYVFSRPTFVWDDLEETKTHLIAPSIDAFSPKNREMDATTVTAILHAAGLVPDGESPGDPVFLREDGTPARVEHRAEVFEDAPPSLTGRLVLQVSRWDALKDPIGVIEGFAQHVAPRSNAHMVYAGPAVEAVSDDPEGAEVLKQAISVWRELPGDQRRRVHLACLPMVDGAENAAIVNALQRRAFVVVQKSLAEGFGLTVAEAMWKGRPVVASRIGGIQDQIEDGKTGILLDDPRDRAGYGEAVLSLLHDEPRAEAMGRAAMERVRDEFLGARSLLQYVALLEGLIR